MREPPTGTVTYLFTDIEGSTQLWGKYPAAMKVALAHHDALVRETIESHGGYVFKTVGDAFCAAFRTAPEALAAALGVQRALHAENWGETPLRVRMSLHTGNAEERDGDYFGPPLNRVARLLSAGHGGQVLLSAATQELVRDQLPEGASLRDLGERRLKDLDRAERIFQLVVPDWPADFPPLKTLEVFPNNLPVQLTSFVGREKEMAEIKRLLAAARLLTLTGPGGTGKTRLALQVAADSLDAFLDGVWLVELADISDPALVPQSVATVFGVREEPGHPLTKTLADRLHSKSLLLILDNCEHLIEACAQLAEMLLHACPNLKILTSSREALRIVGETSFCVPSLLLPDVDRLPVVQVLTQYEAVRLFIDRAVAIRPNFRVTNVNAPTLAQICHQLDGIPLAIELAAARVKAMSVEQIAARLDDRFRLLVRGSRTAFPRQQTLRALIDWSYDLLSKTEQMLLRRLSVFWGGWSLEAAESVCSGAGVDTYDVLDLLARLVDKSLVMLREPDRDMRYRTLETIRQYARDRLLETGEMEQVRNQHLDFFLRLVEEAEPKLQGAEQAAWLERLETEHDNLRASLEWALESGQTELGLRLVGALWPFWDTHGHFGEGRKRLDQILAKSDERIIARAKALIGASFLAIRQGDTLRSLALIEEGLALSRELDYKRGIAESLLYLGIYSISFQTQSHIKERKEALYAESLDLWRELGDKRGIARALGPMASLARDSFDYSRAALLFEESLALFREVDDKKEIAGALWNLGNVTLIQGDYERTETFFHESLMLYQELGDKHGVATLLKYLGKMTGDQGDAVRAGTLYEESVALFRELGDKGCLALALGEWGKVMCQLGDAGRATLLGEESLALCGELGIVEESHLPLSVLGRVALSRDDTERAKSLFAQSLALLRDSENKQDLPVLLEQMASVLVTMAAQQEQPPIAEKAAQLFGSAEAGREIASTPLPPSERTEYERNVATILAQLGEVTFAAAWAEGRAITMDQAIDYALEK